MSLRAEIRHRIGGKDAPERCFRLSNADVETIERACDAGLFRIMQRIQQGDPRLSNLAVVLSSTCTDKEGLPLSEAFELVGRHHRDACEAAVLILASAFQTPEGADPKARRG